MAEKVALDLGRTEQIGQIDVCYFSWRGATKKVAEQIISSLKTHPVRVIEIKPFRDYPYIVWLLMSFIPGFGVKSEFNKPESKIMFLCLPKWTFNCPPITYFLKKVNLEGKVVFLAITYGGFDEKRYAESLKKSLEKRGAEVGDVILVKRKHLEENSEDVMENISNWAVRCVHMMGRELEG
jgi:flavodoxin